MILGDKGTEAVGKRLGSKDTWRAPREMNEERERGWKKQGMKKTTVQAPGRFSRSEHTSVNRTPSNKMDQRSST
eukprot:5882816-Pyramimonas_sp.AAC.1